MVVFVLKGHPDSGCDTHTKWKKKLGTDKDSSSPRKIGVVGLVVDEIRLPVGRSADGV